MTMCRKIPVWRYTDQQAILAAWGLGLYWGNHQVQDKLGQLISHVKDNGTNPDGFNTRAYTTATAQPLHNDNADIGTLNPFLVFEDCLHVRCSKLHRS